MRFYGDPNAVLQFIILFTSNVLRDWQGGSWPRLKSTLTSFESFRKDAEMHENSKESVLNTAHGEFIQVFHRSDYISFKEYIHTYM